MLDSTGAATSVGFVTDANLGWIWPDPAIKMFRSAAIHFPKGVDTTFTINGLTTGSIYNVWIASATDNIPAERFHGTWSTPNNTTTVGAQDIDNVTIDNTSTWEYGVNYVLFEKVVADANGEITFIGDATDAGEFDNLDYRLGLSGWQIAEVLEPGTPFCFGNSSEGNACPCGNDNDGSAPLGGCAHGSSSAGAYLDGSGVASIGSDSVVLHGTRGQPSNSGLFVQALNDLDGQGIFLGDGIRCAGGTLKRLKVAFADVNGDADTTGVSQGLWQRSSDLGYDISPGETIYYYWWIRDTAGSPCSTDNNTSNGYAITWLP